MRIAAAASAARLVGGPTAGYVAVGVSGFALLASGPRLLGSIEYSLLAVAWTMVTIVGVGLAQPGEQTVTRVIAGGGQHGVSRTVVLRLLVVAAAALLLPALSWTGRSPWFGASALWAWSVVIAVAGWALVSGPRGRLAGASDFRSYSAVLLAEAFVRMLVIAAAWALPSLAAPLLAAAIGVPLVAAAVVAVVLARRHNTDSRPAERPAHFQEQGVITAVALLGQVALSTAPLWLQAQSPDAALAGAFVTATSYFRIPILFIGGLAAVALTAVSASVSNGDVGSARRQARGSLLGATAVGVAGASALLLLAPLLLRLYYGQQIDLGPGVLMTLAATTVLAIAAGMLTQVLYGARRGATALAVWAIATAVTTLLLATARGDVLRTAVGVAIGQLIATAALALASVRALPAAAPLSIKP